MGSFRKSARGLSAFLVFLSVLGGDSTSFAAKRGKKKEVAKINVKSSVGGRSGLLKKNAGAFGEMSAMSKFLLCAGLLDVVKISYSGRGAIEESVSKFELLIRRKINSEKYDEQGGVSFEDVFPDAVHLSRVGIWVLGAHKLPRPIANLVIFTKGNTFDLIFAFGAGLRGCETADKYIDYLSGGRKSMISWKFLKEWKSSPQARIAYNVGYYLGKLWGACKKVTSGDTPGGLNSAQYPFEDFDYHQDLGNKLEIKNANEEDVE